MTSTTIKQINKLKETQEIDISFNLKVYYIENMEKYIKDLERAASNCDSKFSSAEQILRSIVNILKGY